jgi:hypothetical protein
MIWKEDENEKRKLKHTYVVTIQGKLRDDGLTE